MAVVETPSLPRPGEIIRYEFRKSRLGSSAHGPLRLVQWNIERGYQLNAIVHELEQLDADVICLQELDIGCKRSHGVNTALEIAKALRLCCVFVCEFVEVDDKCRRPLDGGGGVHGNAILSKYDIVSPRPLLHQYQPFHWEINGKLKNEPRLGR
jgi:hypothetical protein